jgi:hypothetical protein
MARHGSFSFRFVRTGRSHSFRFVESKVRQDEERVRTLPALRRCLLLTAAGLPQSLLFLSRGGQRVRTLASLVPQHGVSWSLMLLMLARRFFRAV